MGVKVKVKGRSESDEALSLWPSRSLVSDDGEPLAALQTTSFDDFAAAFGGHARAVTDFTGALFAVRTERRFHDSEKKRGSEVPDALGSVKGGLGWVDGARSIRMPGLNFRSSGLSSA